MMMEEQHLDPIKRTVHIKVTSRLLNTSHLHSQTLRFFCDDVDATDSSDDDFCSHRRRVKRYVQEIKFQSATCSAKVKPSKTSAGQKKKKKKKKKLLQIPPRFRGVRRRVWLGTFDTAEEAAMVYDSAAIQLGGPAATTNFSPPTPAAISGGYDSTEDSHNTCSPTSVLRAFPCIVAAGEAGFAEFEKDLNVFDEMPLNCELMDFSLYEQMVFGESRVEPCFFAGEPITPYQYGGYEIGSSSFQDGQDFFQEITDLFPLDPLTKTIF